MVFVKNTLMALVMMWRCFEYGMYTRNPMINRTCAQMKT